MLNYIKKSLQIQKEFEPFLEQYIIKKGNSVIFIGTDSECKTFLQKHTIKFKL